MPTRQVWDLYESGDTYRYPASISVQSRNYNCSRESSVLSITEGDFRPPSIKSSRVYCTYERPFWKDINACERLPVRTVSPPLGLLWW